MDAAGWMWLLLLVEVGLIDAILALFHRATLSQWIWRQHRRHWWSRWLVLGALVILTVHLVWRVWGKPTPVPTPTVVSAPLCDEDL